jgi:hypothetical protein
MLPLQSKFGLFLANFDELNYKRNPSVSSRLFLKIVRTRRISEESQEENINNTMRRQTSVYNMMELLRLVLTDTIK